MKKILISFAALAVSAAAIVAVNANKKMNEQFEANVEALAGGEYLDNTHMYIWWVEEHGGGAITCTLGGDLPCK